MILRVASQNRGELPISDWQRHKGVVYVIYHTKSSKFYVGESGRDALTRLTEHWAHRTQKSATALSQLMGLNDDVPHYIDQFRVFVIAHQSADVLRRDLEQDYISRFRSSSFGRARCLNKVFQSGQRRLRHRPPPIGPPSAEATSQPQRRRDMQPTLHHLQHLSNDNRFAALAKMSRKTLHRVKRSLPKSAPMRSIVADTLVHKLNEPKPATERIPTFMAQHATRKMQRTSVSRIIAASEATWPLEKKYLKPRVMFRCNVEAGRSFRNHTAASLKIQECDIACGCATVDARFKPRDGEHVLTVDTRVLESLLPPNTSDDVRELIEDRGSKFRFSLEDLAAKEIFRENALAYANRCKKASRLEVDEHRIETWVDALTDAYVADIEAQQRPKGLRKLPKGLIAKIHEKFVIAPCDKNAQKSVIWCKKLYHDVIYASLSSETYERVDMSAAEVVAKNDAFAQTVGHRGHQPLPYPYMLAKLHKLDTHREPFRPLIGKSSKNTPSGDHYRIKNVTSLTDVARNVDQMVQSVLDLLLLQDRKQKIKRFWVIRTPQEFLDVVGSAPRVSQQTTKDFTQMYTNLPHDQLIEGCNAAIDHVVPELARRFELTAAEAAQKLRFTATGKWTTREDEGWSIATLKQALAYVVQNNYVLVNGQVFRQKFGVGMGVECSPSVSNLFLHWKERQYVERKIEELGEDEVMRRYEGFRYHCRFIDDLYAPLPDDDFPSDADYGGLRLVKTYESHRAGEAVIFLGIKAELTTDGKVIFSARDKQQAFEFKIVRYPSFDSNVPWHCKVGTIVGMLCRTLQLTTLTPHFIAECRFVLSCFRERGYTDRLLRAGVYKFAQRFIAAHARKSIAEAILEAPSREPQPNAAGDDAESISSSSSSSSPTSPRSRRASSTSHTSSSSSSDAGDPPAGTPPPPIGPASAPPPPPPGRLRSGRVRSEPAPRSLRIGRRRAVTYVVHNHYSTPSLGSTAASTLNVPVRFVVSEAGGEHIVHAPAVHLRVAPPEVRTLPTEQQHVDVCAPDVIMNVLPSKVLQHAAATREVELHAPDVAVTVNASEVFTRQGTAVSREREISAPDVHVNVNASQVTFQHSEPAVVTTTAPNVLAIVAPSAVNCVPAESPTVFAQAPDVCAVIQPSSLQVTQAEAAQVNVDAPAVAVRVNQPLVRQIAPPDAAQTVELLAPTVQAVVKASEVVACPGPEREITLHAPAVKATIGASNVHQPSRADNVPSHFPDAAAAGQAQSARFNVNVGHANVGCQGTFVTNYFVVNPAATPTATAAGSSSPSASGANAPAGKSDEFAWVAHIAQVLLLCSGCAIARALSERLERVSRAPGPSQREELVQVLSEPANLSLTMGSLIADFEAKLHDAPLDQRPEVWQRSTLKAACDSLQTHVPAMAKMHAISNSFVHAGGSCPSVAEVRSLVGITNAGDCRAGDLTTNTGWSATANALITSSCDAVPATPCPSPRGVLGSIAAFELLKDIGRGAYDTRLATVAEMEQGTSNLCVRDVLVVGVNKNKVEVQLTDSDTTFHLPQRGKILLAACVGADAAQVCARLQHQTPSAAMH
jgi:hypothetical protein